MARRITVFSKIIKFLHFWEQKRCNRLYICLLLFIKDSMCNLRPCYLSISESFDDLYFQSIDHRCLLYVSSSWAIEEVRHHFCFRVVTWRYSVYIKPSVVAFLWLHLATGSDGNLAASQNLSNNIARDRSLTYSYF